MSDRLTKRLDHFMDMWLSKAAQKEFVKLVEAVHHQARKETEDWIAERRKELGVR